jgi:hypothetical protein
MDDLLFNKGDIFAVLQAQTENVKKRIQSIPANTIPNASEQDLQQSLAEEFRLNVPVIKEGDIYIAHAGETQVDVSGDPRRRFIYHHHPGGPFYVPGNKTVIAIPFEGDAGFFKIRPQTYDLNPPRGEVKDDEVRITYVRTDQDGEAVKRDYQAAVSSIHGSLRLGCSGGAQVGAAGTSRQLRGAVSCHRSRSFSAHVAYG